MLIVRIARNRYYKNKHIVPNLDTERMIAVARNRNPKTHSYSNAGVADDDHTIVITTQAEYVDFLQKHRLTESFRTKVVGVTFRNDDGSSRQPILAKCHSGDPVALKLYFYEGLPAFAVVTENGQIGTLSQEEATRLYTRYGDSAIYRAEIDHVSGGYSGRNFGCVVSVEVYLDIIEKAQISKNPSRILQGSYEGIAAGAVPKSHGINAEPDISAEPPTRSVDIPRTIVAILLKAITFAVIWIVSFYLLLFLLVPNDGVIPPVCAAVLFLAPTAIGVTCVSPKFRRYLKRKFGR